WRLAKLRSLAADALDGPEREPNAQHSLHGSAPLSPPGRSVLRDTAALQCVIAFPAPPKIHHSAALPQASALPPTTAPPAPTPPGIERDWPHRILPAHLPIPIRRRELVLLPASSDQERQAPWR